MTDDLGSISTNPKTGRERFKKRDRDIGFDLIDFWSWSGSDLLSNAHRGVLAEYIVARDLDVTATPRKEWDPFDLQTKSGTTVEVKSAAYLQSWHQKRPSSISFSIAPTRAWDEDSGDYAEVKRRQAKVYVFCLLAHKNKKTVDPLDLDQWRFFVLPTARLEDELGSQQRLSLSRLLQLEPVETEFGHLENVIDEAGRHGSCPGK